MKIGILGSGMVGSTIGSKLLTMRHEVMMGSRSATNEKAAAWVAANGECASQGTFQDAAAFGEMIFVCTKGEGTLDAVNMAGNENCKGKIVIDISNPLDFNKGMPPSLFISNTNSLGEEVQRLLPDAHVVKTLNMVNCMIMVDASQIEGEPDMLLCGENADAKKQVTELLHAFGWKRAIDLGGIDGSRAMESLLPLWVRLYMVTENGTWTFKFLNKV